MLWLGTDVNVMIHDHLDGALVRLKILAESGLMFAPFGATIPNVMNGAPRSSFGSELNVLLWLVYFFGPFAAYVLNQIIIRVVAFGGMYLLLKTHVLNQEKNEVVSVGSALTFACLPFYPSLGLSVAGLALALYAFLNFREQHADWKDWLILSIIPFYAIFGISTLFLIGAMGGLLIYDWSRLHKLNFRFAGAVVFMLGISVLVDYRLILTMIMPSIGFVSHRIEFSYGFESYTFFDAIKDAKDNFVFGQGHAASLQQYIILPIVGVAVVTILFRRIKGQKIFKLLGVIILISLWYGLWPFCWNQIRNVIKGLPFFNLGRFHYLHPVLWYVLFALALQTVWLHLRFGRILVIAALVVQTGFLFHQSDHLVARRKWQPSYAQFFSTQLFTDIDKFIGRNKKDYRVVSVGIHPSIAQYSGFYTLDGRFFSYPLSYKHQFRLLMAGELEKSEYWRSYYDGWGCRINIMARDLQDYQATAFMLRKQLVQGSKIRIEQLSFNTKVFKQMGGEYIFSAVEIVNSQEIGLRLVKIFERSDAVWQIHLYQAV
jgi:hypothetical protein